MQAALGVILKRGDFIASEPLFSNLRPASSCLAFSLTILFLPLAGKKMKPLELEQAKDGQGSDWEEGLFCM